MLPVIDVSPVYFFCQGEKAAELPAYASPPSGPWLSRLKEYNANRKNNKGKNLSY